MAYLHHRWRYLNKRRTCNRHVKFGLKIPIRLKKKFPENPGGGFFGLTLYYLVTVVMLSNIH